MQDCYCCSACGEAGPESLSGSPQDTQPYKTGSTSCLLTPSEKPGDAGAPECTKGCPWEQWSTLGRCLGPGVQLSGPRPCCHHSQAVGPWAQDLTLLRLTSSFENSGKFYPLHEDFKEVYVSLSLSLSPNMY